MIRDVRAGVPTRLTATVLDARTGEPVTDVVRSHDAWMHLIATRTDRFSVRALMMFAARWTLRPRSSTSSFPSEVSLWLSTRLLPRAFSSSLIQSRILRSVVSKGIAASFSEPASR